MHKLVQIKLCVYVAHIRLRSLSRTAHTEGCCSTGTRNVIYRCKGFMYRAAFYINGDHGRCFRHSNRVAQIKVLDKVQYVAQ